jgi:hypothetical protein
MGRPIRDGVPTRDVEVSVPCRIKSNIIMEEAAVFSTAMPEQSLLEPLAASINEQVKVVVQSLQPSQLPHLYQAASFPPLDDSVSPAPVFDAFQKILTDAQALISLFQPWKVHLLNICSFRSRKPGSASCFRMGNCGCHSQCRRVH